MQKTAQKSGLRKTKADSDQLRWMYTQMVRIREFEESVKRTFIEHPGRDPRTLSPGRRR